MTCIFFLRYETWRFQWCSNFDLWAILNSGVANGNNFFYHPEDFKGIHCSEAIYSLHFFCFYFAEIGLVGKGVTFRIGRIPVQTLLGAWPGSLQGSPWPLGQISIKTQWLTSGSRACPLDSGPKLALGHSNSS